MARYIFRQLYVSLVLATLISFISFAAYGIFEPLFAVAATSQTVTVTLAVTTGVAVTVDSNAITMSTNLGVSTNSAIGTSTFTVTTNDGNGYTFTLAASTNPAMQSGSNTINDAATTTSPQLWASALPSTGAIFGFSVYGSDISPTGATYWGTSPGTGCGATSTPSTTLKYSGFFINATTTAKNSSTTTPSGDSTVVCYAVQQHNTYIPAGIYTASITGTATAN